MKVHAMAFLAVVSCAGGAVFAAAGQVTEARAFHRAGQTFITWKEVEPLIVKDAVTYGEYKKALADAKSPVRYRVYTAKKAIDAASLKDAELIGEVGPLSAYNINARNKEYLIGQAMIKKDEVGELARRHNHEMHTWGPNSDRMNRYPLRRFVINEKDGPLSPGTGLYVHHPRKAGKHYYAVVAVRDGAANTADFGGNTAGPVAETVGPGVPVRQGKGLWGPFFDYPGTRWVYAQWCAPPLSPKRNMVFNWSVLVPPNTGDPEKPALPGMKAYTKVPAELYFHEAGYSYAQPNRKLLIHSIQIAPHDYPFSGWYGFNEAWGTDKDFEDGKVSNHTQKRIVAFLEWAVERFPIDDKQIICAGADGAASLALNYPDVFAYVWITGFDRRGGVLDERAAKKYEAIWGPRNPKILDDKGWANWAWADLGKLALAGEKDLPLFVCLGLSWGRTSRHRGEDRFYKAMTEAHQPVMGYWGWNAERGRGELNPYTGRWRGKQITKDSPIPAFSNSTRDADKAQFGTTSGSFGWKDVVDTKDTFAITILSDQGTFDLTPRRLSNFKPAPGTQLKWKAIAVKGRRMKEEPKPQSGTVLVAKDGTFTITGLEYPRRSPRMRVTVQK
jgi:hypothetical protein